MSPPKHTNSLRCELAALRFELLIEGLQFILGLRGRPFEDLHAGESRILCVLALHYLRHEAIPGALEFGDRTSNLRDELVADYAFQKLLNEKLIKDY